MEKMRTIYRLSDEEILNNQFIMDMEPQFYHYVATQLDHDFNDPTIRFECRKINVAANIQDVWFAESKKRGESTHSLAMLLVQLGPKVNDTLGDNEVEFEEGFIYYEN